MRAHARDCSCANPFFAARFRARAQDLDLALPANAGDEEVLAQLRAHLPAVLDATKPTLVLFDAGTFQKRPPKSSLYYLSLSLSLSLARARDSIQLERESRER